MRVPTPPGPHFSAGELLRIRSETGPLTCETEVRVIHHLALLCPHCWDAVWGLPPLPDGEYLGAEPVVRALGRLGLPNERHVALGADHSRALVEAWRRPLGFCHLVLEEAWLVVQRCPRGQTDLLYSAFGPIGGNGACLQAPRAAHDLQARFFNLLAKAYYRAREMDRAESALALAEAHLARGAAKQGRNLTLPEIEALVAALGAAEEPHSECALVLPAEGDPELPYQDEA